MADRRCAPDLTIVTGADGWFGRALLAALTGDGPWHRTGTIRALAHDAEQADHLRAAHPGIEVVVGDVAVSRSLLPLFDGAGATTDVIHAAGVIHPASVAGFTRVNDHGTQHVADLSGRVGVRRLVHVSSNSPFGTNPDPADTFRNDEPYRPYLGYGESKMRGELHVKASGVDHVIVRPPWFYGPHQPARQTTFFTMVKTGRFPVFGAGQQRRSMVYVDNLVQGVVLAELAELPPGASRGFWIADERPYTVAEIVETVGEALRLEGHQVAKNRTRLPSLAGDVAELADRLLQSRGKYQQALHVLGEMNKTIACDISVSRSVLGYDPQVSLLDGMRTSIRWCAANGIEL